MHPSKLPSQFAPALPHLILVCVIALGVCARVESVEAANPDGVWSQLQAPPSGRRAAGYTYDSIRHRLIVFGGFPTYLNDVWAFDLALRRWEKITPFGPSPVPRYGPTAIFDAANDRLIVFGGFDGAVERNDVWALSLSGSPAWTQLAPAGVPPLGRSFHVACYDAPRQRMVMFSGWSGAAFLADTWELSLGGSPAWSALNSAGPAPPARNLAGVAYDTLRERMVVFGGWSGTYHSDTWALSLSGSPDWSLIAAPSPPPGRREISIAYDAEDDRIVLFGGNDGAYLSDSWELPLGGSPDWQELSPVTQTPKPRYGHASIYDPLADEMVIFGGAAESVHLSDVWSLDSDGAPSWTLLTPRATQNYSAVVDPVAHEMLVFGGMGVNQALSNDLVAFALSPQPYHARRVVQAGPWPTERYAHRAVWDPVRDRMLVFGGYVQAGMFVNELWEFRPRPTPAWNQLAPAGVAPSPRFAGGLVFDEERDRLIAFGGYSTDEYGNNPTAWNDTWALPLSGAGAMTWQALAPAGTPPGVRWGCTMVMDAGRDRAIVFGGATALYSFYNDAFELDLSVPGTAWSALSPLGTPPTPRTIHTGIRDVMNDRLVVFGGFDGTFLNDVHAMSLGGSPQWTALAPAGGPPSARDAITAVYDPAGMRMVVFGGLGGTTLEDSWALTWDVVVPVLVSLVSAHAEPGLVRVTWQVPDASGVQAQVERREGEQGWLPIGAAAQSAVDRLVIEDRDVVAGRGYAYRLRLRAGGEETISEVTEVRVPAGFRLELAGAHPNPASSEDLRVDFALPRGMRARLELIDLLGRRLSNQEVGSLGAGRHRVALRSDTRPAPGIYHLRLETEDGTISRRVCLID